MLVAERLPVEYFRYIELSVSRHVTFWQDDGVIVSGQNDEPNFSGPFLGYYKGKLRNQ